MSQRILKKLQKKIEYERHVLDKAWKLIEEQLEKEKGDTPFTKEKK